MHGLEIVEARRTAGVAQRDLARALGLPPQRLSDIERGYIPMPNCFDKRVHEALKHVLNERLKMVEGQ